MKLAATFALLALLFPSGCGEDKPRKRTRMDLRPEGLRNQPTDQGTGLRPGQIRQLPPGLGTPTLSGSQVLWLSPTSLVIAGTPIAANVDDAARQLAQLNAAVDALPPGPAVFAATPETPLLLVDMLARRLVAKGRGDLWLATRTPEGSVNVLPFCAEVPLGKHCHGNQRTATTGVLALALGDGAATFTTPDTARPVTVQLAAGALAALIAGYTPDAELVLFELSARNEATTIANLALALVVGATPSRPVIRFVLAPPPAPAPAEHLHPAGTPAHQHGPGTLPDHGASPLPVPPPVG